MTSHMGRPPPSPPFPSPPLLTLLSLAPGESVVKCLERTKERTAINGWPEKAAAAPVEKDGGGGGGGRSVSAL